MATYEKNRNRVIGALLAAGYGSGGKVGFEILRHGDHILVGRAFRRNLFEPDITGIVSAYARVLEEEMHRLKCKGLEVHATCDASPRIHVHLTY